MPQYYSYNENNWTYEPVSESQLRSALAPAGEIPSVDYSGSDVTFQGAPKWFSQAKELLFREAHRISKQVGYPYGLAPSVQERYDRALADLEAKEKNVPPYAIAFAPVGSNQPVFFTPEQLYRASNDDRFAQRIFEANTGTKNAPRQDVEEFRQRIVTELPNLPSLVAKHEEDIRKEIIKEENASKAKDIIDRSRELSILRNKYWKGSTPTERLNLRRDLPSFEPIEKEIITKSKELADHALSIYKSVEGTGSPLEELSDEAFLSETRKSSPLSFGGHFLNKEMLSRFTPLQHGESGPSLFPRGVLIPEDTDENLLERLGIQRQKELEASRVGRVAPLNQLHYQAERMMQRNIGSEAPSFEASNKGIKEAMAMHPGRSIQSYINIATAPSHELLSQAEREMSDYDRNVIRALREEAKENFLEEVLPSIQGTFTSSGAYHSGARQAQLDKFAQKSQMQLNRDIAKMLHSNRENALQRAGQRSERALNAANTVGQAEKAQQEALLSGSAHLRQQGLSEKEAHKHDIAATSQFASAQQRQLQNEMLARQQMDEEQRLEAERKTGWLANIYAGQPAPSTLSSRVAAANVPTPPNPYNVGAGLLGQITGVEQRQKKGGSVKRHYAPGGSIDRFMEMGKHIKPGPYDQEIEGLASNIKGYRVDPMKNWLRHVSAQMLAHNTEDPLSNMGKGAMLAEESMKTHDSQMMNAKIQAANLYNAMNKSRAAQHNFLAKYEQSEKAAAELARHHRAEESIRGKETEQEKYSPQEIDIGETIIRPRRKIGLSSPDVTHLKSIEKNRELNASKLHGYESMLDFLNRSERQDDMPLTGVIAKYTPNLSDKAKEYERHLEKMVAGELPSGVLTNAKLAFAKGLKPTDLDSPEKVKQFAELGREHYQDLVDRDQLAEDMSAYNIPPRVSFAAYDQWKKNGKKGEPLDYIKIILEGGAMKKENLSSDKDDFIDLSGLSDEELERIAAQ